MNDMTFADFVRGIFIATCFIVAVGFALRFWRPRRWSDPEYKLLHAGVFFAIVALGGRSYIAIQEGDPLVWPLAFFAAALVCWAGYLTSPRGKR